jgi:hypothetical protein
VPKATWSNSDLDAGEIESAESNGSYDGQLPPRGVYRFKLREMKKEVSKAGNDMIAVTAFLDGSWKPEHKKFDGCPLWERITLSKSTAWKPKELCAALGVSANDLLTKTIVDSDGAIQKIGNKVIAGKDVLVYASVRIEKSEGYDDKLKANRLLEAPDEEGDEAAEETPAANGKAKKDKKGKKGASATEEDPF